MNKNKKCVLVTGANGFVGSNLCSALSDKGYYVVGLVYGRDKNAEFAGKNIKMAAGDVTDFPGIFKIIKKYKPEAVFHTAALLPSADKDDDAFSFFGINAGGTLNLLEACRASKVKNFIYSSSMSVYGKDIKYLPVDESHPTNPCDFYSLSKKQGEDFCKLYSAKYGLNVIVLRYAGVYGEEKKDGVVANFINRALSNKPLEIKSDTSWDLVYVKDIAEANIKAFEKADKLNFEIINIGSGQETKIKNLAEEIIKMSGSKSEIKIHENLPKSRFYFNISKVEGLLGFIPTPVAQGLKYIILERKIGQ